MSDQFEFTQEFVGETIEEVSDVTAIDAPIDLDNPGFASLLTLLREHGNGNLPDWMIDIYLHALTRNVLDCRAKLNAMPIPPLIREHAELAMQAMNHAMDEFQGVLEQVRLYVETHEREALEAAITKLEIVHMELPGFIGQLQTYSRIVPEGGAPAEAPAEE